MTKLEIMNAILDVNEQKRTSVKNQRYEEGAILRDKEKNLFAMLLKEYNLDIFDKNLYWEEVQNLLKSLIREEQINQILE